MQYTDDCLVVSENAESILKNEIGRYFELKPDSIGPPRLYLGGHLRKIELSNGVEAWYFSSTQYVQTAVKNVEEYLVKKGQSLKAKALDPLPRDIVRKLMFRKNLGQKRHPTIRL